MAEPSAWRKSLRPASFRGVPFEVPGVEQPLGRKVVRHDFALRDTSLGEDMGKVTATFDLEAFIIGPDYMPARDAFEAALNTKGVGELIHPWRGKKSVRLMEASAKESISEGGMVRYSLKFMEEAVAPSLVQAANTGAQVSTAAADLQATTDTQFDTTFSVAGQPNFVAERAGDLVQSLADKFDDLTAPLQAQGDDLTGYIAQALDLRSDVLTLVTKPLSLRGQISSLIQGIRQAAATPADAFGVLKGLLSFGSGFATVNRTTAARIAQADNQAALVAYVRHTAIAEAVQAVAEIDFDAYQDAVDVRDQTADLIDDVAIVAADAGDVTSWWALDEARLATIADVTVRGGSLARLYDFTPVITVPALVLAYRLYDDVTRLEERTGQLVARNKIVNPAFVPGGATLEVLSDV